MNDAQAWTAIGGMLAIFLAYMTLMVRMFGSTLDARFAAVDARFESAERRFDQFDQRFDRLELRFDNLDRDIQAIARRFWDGPTTA